MIKCFFTWLGLPDVLICWTSKRGHMCCRQFGHFGVHRCACTQHAWDRTDVLGS